MKVVGGGSGAKDSSGSTFDLFKEPHPDALNIGGLLEVLDGVVDCPLFAVELGVWLAGV